MAILIRKNKAAKPRYRVRVRDALGKEYPTKTFATLIDAKRYERELQDKKDKKYILAVKTTDYECQNKAVSV